MSVTKKRVVFIGGKIKSYAYVQKPFIGSNDWIVETKYVDDGMYGMVIGMSGIQDYNRYHHGSVPRMICLDCNPYGIRDTPDVPFRVMLDSYSFDHCRPVGPSYDDRKWDRHRKLLNLPVTPSKWVQRKSGAIVCLLPRAGGWQNPDIPTFVTKYSSLVAKVAKENPESAVYVRPHPKSDHFTPQATKKIMSNVYLTKANNVVLNTTPVDILQRNTRCVVSDWGTCCIQFAMHGVPIVNFFGNRFIASEVALKGVGDTGNSEAISRIPSPPEFMNRIAQNVFTKTDFDSGDFMDYIDARCPA